jgi:hypothetical protein
MDPAKHRLEPPHQLNEAIHQLVHTTPQTIDFELKTVQQVNSPRQLVTSTDLAEFKKQVHPTFIYSYKYNTGQLWRTNLLTGEHSCHDLPSYQSRFGCCWTELPGSYLLVTGGDWTSVREVVRIDTLREFAVSQEPPMLTPRRAHTAVYHAECLYALGGYNGSSCLSACERYVCAETRWEALPPLPVAGCGMSGVVMERSLYSLGGYAGQALDSVQKLSLETLTWEILELRLPQAGYLIPCFMHRDSQVYFVMHKTLYAFTPLQVTPLKTLPQDIRCLGGPSLYNRGTLYCSVDGGAANSLQIGLINNPKS